MVVYTLSKQVTQWIGPVLFRWGTRTRNRLAPMVGGSGSGGDVDTPSLDLLCGLPYAQKLLSLSVYDESAKRVAKHHQMSRVERALDSTYDALFGLLNNTNNNNNNNNSKGVRKDDDNHEMIESSQNNHRPPTIAELRVQVLDDELRPALVPHDTWRDVLDWKTNPRTLKWIRQEFLIAKYGPLVKEALDAYPQLRASPQLVRHPTHRMLLQLARHGRFDPWSASSSNNNNNNNNGEEEHSAAATKKAFKTLLPSSETLVKAFGMQHWAHTKNTQRIRQSMVPIAEQLDGQVLTTTKTTHESGTNGDDEETLLLLNHAEIPETADLSHLSFEDILEVAGGQVQYCGPWNTICEEADLYQLWTQEYVQQLAEYLLKRSQDETKETLILDIGAGDGLLLHFVQQHMNHHRRRSRRRRGSGKQDSSNLPTLIATDDGSWGIFAKTQVEKLSVEETLKKYCPTLSKDESATTKVSPTNSEASAVGPNKKHIIVLCSWMPMGHDWSQLFRNAHIDEYILIGEADDGSCGHNWKTWGNLDFFDDNDNGEREQYGLDGSRVPPTPLYERDGYERWNMNVLSQFQFSRFDCAVSRSSTTVSFRRRRRKNSRVNQ